MWRLGRGRDVRASAKRAGEMGSVVADMGDRGVVQKWGFGLVVCGGIGERVGWIG